MRNRDAEASLVDHVLDKKLANFYLVLSIFQRWKGFTLFRFQVFLHWVSAYKFKEMLVREIQYNTMQYKTIKFIRFQNGISIPNFQLKFETRTSKTYLKNTEIFQT